MRKKKQIKALMECEIEFKTVDMVNHVSPSIKYIDAQLDPVRIAMEIVDGSNYLLDEYGTVYPMTSVLSVNCNKIRNFAALVTEHKDLYNPEEIQEV